MKTLLTILAMFLFAACGPANGPQATTLGFPPDKPMASPTPLVGPQGPPGPPGANGEPASPVIAVALCPGIPTYGHVQEVAFCISGVLYALDQNSGSTDLIIGPLLPGSYVDANGNLGCTFTVGDNCAVSH